MTEDIIFFEVSALPILLILIVSTLSRKMTRGRPNILLFLVLILAFVSSLTDTVSNAVTQRAPLNDTERFITDLFNYIYFVTRNGLNCVYVFYIIAVTRTWYKIRAWWKKLLIMAPYLGILAMLVMNPYNHAVFTVTHEAGYCRGPRISMIYLFAACYLVIGITYLMLHKKLLAMEEWLSLSVLYVFNVIGVVIQFLFPHLFVECYFTSITLIFVVLYVQKPERVIDVNTGLPGFFAFKNIMKRIEVSGEKAQVIIVSINNAEELKRYLGEESFIDYIHTVEQAMSAYGKKIRLDNERYFEAPGMFYIIVSDMKYNPVQSIQDIREMIGKKRNMVTDSGMRLDLKIVSVKVPEEIDNAQEIIRFAHSFSKYTSDKILYHTEQIVGQRVYQIEARFDEILRRAIRDRSLVVNFRPVWSVVRNRAMFTEAVPGIEDPDFGFIDEAMIREAASVRGVTVLLEEYVLEQAFAHVKNLRLDRNGPAYIVVKLSETLGIQQNFTDTVWNLRSKYDAHPEQICFAIEGAGPGSAGEVFRNNIRQLSRLGYKIALDNYGNGYTDLRNLSSYAISSIRLDRSMTANVNNNESKAILGGTIAMLKRIPLAVVVTGVDDKNMRNMLAEMGCELMQGALFDEDAGNPQT